MTGMSVLRHAYALMEQPRRLAAAEESETGLTAVNYIYSDLWKREHTEPFEPLTHLRQEVALSWRCLPALTYGTAALLCLHGADERPYERYLELYMRALTHTGSYLSHRRDVMAGEGIG